MKVTLNGEARDLAAPLTLQQWLEQLNPGGGRVAVVVNDRVIPAAERTSLVLKDGDQVELLTCHGLQHVGTGKGSEPNGTKVAPPGAL